MWRYHLAIKDLLDAEESDIVARRIGKAIAPRLRGCRDYTVDFQVEELAAKFEDVESVDELNDSLMDLYDWADANLVWVD